MTATKADRSKTPLAAIADTTVMPADKPPGHEQSQATLDQRSAAHPADRVAILVLGMHRSGTSALTRVISLLGADLPSNLMPAVAGNNETGFWESLDAYALNDDILASAGSSWDDWRRFNSGWNSSPAKQAFQRRAAELLSKDFSESSLFVLKDPRICRLVPFWLEALREFEARPMFVLPVRSPLDVAASLRKRDGFSPAKSHMIWLRYVLDAEYDTRALTRAFVAYDQLIDDWRASVSTLAQTLEFDWPRRSATVDVEIDRFLDHRHRHHISSPQSIAAHPDALAWMTETMASLQRLQAKPYDANALQRLDDVRAEFDRASDALGAVLRAEEMAREELAQASSAHISALKGEAAQRDAYVGDLESDAAKRDATIRELEGAAAQRTKYITDLESDAAERDRRIRELEGAAAQRTRYITDLESDAAKRDALIRELEGAAAARTARIAELETDTAKRDALISELQTAATQLRAQINDLESDAARRDALIDELRGAAEQRTAKLKQLESDAAGREDQTRQLEAAAAQNMARINELTTSLAQRDSQITELEAAATDHKGLISEWTHLAGHREQMVGLLHAKAEAAIENRDQLIARLNGIQSSAAWALARPIRAAESRWPRQVRGIATLPKALWWALTLRLPARLRIRRQALELLAQGLFDEAWYAQQNPDVILNGETPIIHWLLVGWKKGRDPIPLFDVDWYLAQNPEVTEAKLNPLVHYLAQGAAYGCDPSPLFDTDWYLQQNPDVAQAGLNPLVHYLAQGAEQGRDPNPLFDSDWYQEQYPDLVQASTNPLLHYLVAGVAAGCDPSALFDTDWYLEQNPDVAHAGLNPLAHYLVQGAAEGRNPSPLFDAPWYLEQNPDVAQAGINPLAHYIAYGAAEGRDPNALFQSAWYLEQNPDVANAGMGALAHYLAYGAAEGRNPNALFYTDWYLEQNPAVAQAGLNPLIHYLAQGAIQGRDPSPLFDTDWYLEQNPDVAQAGMNPLAHYLRHGAAEGRDPSTLFDTDWYLAANPDVAQANLNPLAHYVESGAAQGRARKPLQASENQALSLQLNDSQIQFPPSERSLIEAEFDVTFYRSVYFDQVHVDDSLGHFLSEGWREGRDPSAGFSTTFYLAANPDVARAGINPFVHYLSVGRLEGRMVMDSLEKPAPKVSDGPVKALRAGVAAMVKNEADIIDAFVSHLLALFDVIEIVDHGSTDGTREFLADVADRYPNVRIYDLKVKGYIQALTMNFLAERSEQLRDVDWLFLLDADEFLPFADRASFAEALLQLAPAPVIEMPWINAVPTRYWEYRVTLTPETPFWLPTHPSPYEKVAYQPRLLRDKPIWIDQGNHALLSFRGGEPLKATAAGFHVIHIPVRSADQFVLKLRQGVSAYQQLGKNRDEAQGTHWNQLWEAIKGTGPSEEMLNGVVRRYGEDAAVESILASALPEHGYVQTPLAAAFEPLDQVILPNRDPNIDPSELMLQMNNSNLAPAVDDGQQEHVPARLDLQGDNEIHAAADDRGFEFARLPVPPEIQSTQSTDLRFIAEFLRPSYWDINDLTPSAWTGHLPFMFCLATLMHPRRFVELGTHYGASFLAYCQAAERGAIPTQAIAIDGWEGDEHVGYYDTSVFDQFKFLLKKYDRFGSYLRMYFHEASTRFEEASIDLLHIDGLHTYEAVREDYATWLPKMSERGLIIFHDINVHERDFGVWRFWKEVKNAHPTMEFRHSHGLGVAYVGTPRGEPIERLISLMSESAEAADLLQQHFEEVAQKSTELFMKRHTLKQQEGQLQAVGQVSEELTRLRQELAATKVDRDEFMRLARVQR